MRFRGDGTLAQGEGRQHEGVVRSYTQDHPSFQILPIGWRSYHTLVVWLSTASDYSKSKHFLASSDPSVYPAHLCLESTCLVGWAEKVDSMARSETTAANTVEL